MLFTKVLVMISAIIIAFGACGQDVGNGEEPVPTVLKVDADGGQELKDVSVQLDIIDEYPGTLIINEKNKCKKNGHKGCLLFEANKKGDITFYLKGSKNKAKTCEQTNEVITKIELTTKGITDEKGDFSGPFPLDRWLREDAFPKVNLENGIAYEATPVNTGLSQVKLFNVNSHSQEEQGILSYWYKVTATACDPNSDGIHETWVADPRGDNEGLD